jgi:hypothetical protein
MPIPHADDQSVINALKNFISEDDAARLLDDYSTVGWRVRKGELVISLTIAIKGSYYANPAR